MRCIKTKTGQMYKVIYENVICDVAHYVCSSMGSYDVKIRCRDVEKTINDCHSLAFVDKDDVVEEFEMEEEE